MGKIKIYHNSKINKVYGLHGKVFYEHVNNFEWVEVASPKTPFRQLTIDTWPTLYSCFSVFLQGEVK